MTPCMTNLNSLILLYSNIVAELFFYLFQVTFDYIIPEWNPTIIYTYHDQIQFWCVHPKNCNLLHRALNVMIYFKAIITLMLSV